MHTYVGAVGQDVVLIDANVSQHRASVSTLSAKEIERMDWPAPSPDVNPIEDDGSLHVQLNHNPGRTSHKRSFRSGQELLVLQSGN